MPNYRKHELLVETYNPEGTIAANRFVSHGTAADGVIAATTADRDVIGISRKAAVATDSEIELVTLGVTMLEVNGNSVNIAAGDPLKPTTAGVGVKGATDKDKCFAIAREAATADAVLIPVYIAFNDIGV